MNLYCVNSVSDENHVSFTKAETERLRVLLSAVSEPSEAGKCTRTQPHDGPCNGWPCDRVKKILEVRDREGLTFDEATKIVDEALRQEEQQAEDAAMDAAADKACYDRNKDYGGIYGHEQTLIRFGVVRGFRAGKARRQEVTRGLLDAFSTAYDAAPIGNGSAELRAGLEAVFDVLYGGKA